MVTLLLLVAMQDAPSCEAPRAEDLVGIWQMSFHPRHEDLYERDAGYLVFLPDGTYWRWDNDYLVEPRADTAATEHGRWSLAPTGTLLRPGDSKTPEGRSIEDSRLAGRTISWCYSRSVLVSLGDQDDPRRLPVLRLESSGGDLNYSFAKIY